MRRGLLDMRNRTKKVGIEMEEILNLLFAGYAAHSIAKRLKCSTSNIFQRLKRRGIRLAPDRRICSNFQRAKIFQELNPDLMV